MRRCGECKEFREEILFGKDNTEKGKRRGGFSYRCKICVKRRNKEFKRKNPEYFKKKGKERYNRADNPARYAATKENFIRRRIEYSTSVRGRFVTLLHSAKCRAAKANLPYELDLQWLLELYNAQRGCCLLTEIKLQFESNRGGTRAFKPFSPSLDRIVPKEGYTKSNTRLVCTAVNLALNNFGESVFEKVAKGYLRKQKGLSKIGML
jgi:hypothetical protein